MLIIKGWKILHVNNNLNGGTLIIQCLFVFHANITESLMKEEVFI